jgi:hypothetical protein
MMPRQLSGGVFLDAISPAITGRCRLAAEDRQVCNTRGGMFGVGSPAVRRRVKAVGFVGAPTGHEGRPDALRTCGRSKAPFGAVSAAGERRPNWR